jgi:hypothetical protein
VGEMTRTGGMLKGLPVLMIAVLKGLP